MRKNTSKQRLSIRPQRKIHECPEIKSKREIRKRKWLVDGEYFGRQSAPYAMCTPNVSSSGDACAENRQNATTYQHHSLSSNLVQLFPCSADHVDRFARPPIYIRAVPDCMCGDCFVLCTTNYGQRLQGRANRGAVWLHYLRVL